MDLDTSGNDSDSDADAGNQLVEPMRALCPSKASSGPCTEIPVPKALGEKRKAPKPQQFSFKQHFKACHLTGTALFLREVTFF